MKKPNVKETLERADALTTQAKVIEDLRTEIKELYQLLGLQYSRVEYARAVKLWYKDTKQKGYVIPDLGGHWAWAIPLIKIGMAVRDNKECILDGCKHCGECNVMTKILGGTDERKRLNKKA